jgi:hypothetical protein
VVRVDVLLMCRVRAEEGGVVTTCELTTYAPDEDEEDNEIAFSAESLVSKIIMKVPTSPFPNTSPHFPTLSSPLPTHPTHIQHFNYPPHVPSGINDRANGYTPHS